MGHHETRSLLGVVVEGLFPWANRKVARALGGAVTVGVALWFTPVSPGALGRADVALGDGDPATAAERYDAVARWNPWPSVRREALWRSALVHAAWLGEPDAARARLERYASGGPVGAKRAEVEEQLGQLLVEAQPRSAAEAFQRAHDAAPKAERAGRRLALAADAWRQAGQRSRAEAAWDALIAAHPTQRAAAEIGRGELALAANEPEQALARYEAALEAATDPLDAELARRGIGQATERMGDLTAAVASFDAEPPDVEAREERRRALVRDRARR